MSAKHRDRSLALVLPPEVRAALKARVGRNGSLADAARRTLQGDWPGDLPFGTIIAPRGRPLRLQLPLVLRTRLADVARTRGLPESALAGGLLRALLR